MKYKLLFYTDYYDGPVSGLVSYEGEELLFYTYSYGGWRVTDYYSDDVMNDFDMCWAPRIYKVAKISKIKIFRLKFRHYIFLRLVKNTHYNSILSKMYWAIFKVNRINYKLLKATGAFSDAEYTII